mmetsp:Transcript_837/g.1905  ORF Transcript_837/g.1905 Transcript_837/m.1905 type:complete len:339 (-) Transcript_837:2512-3528(-)
MEGLAVWLEETLNAKLRPLEQELEAQQTTLRELVAAVTSLAESKSNSKAKPPALDLPKPRPSVKKPEEEHKAGKPGLQRTNSTSGLSGLKSDRDKKSPFQESDENHMRKSMSTVKLPSSNLKKPSRISTAHSKDAAADKKAAAETTKPEVPVEVPSEPVPIVEVVAPHDYTADLEELLKTHRQADLEVQPEFAVSAGARGALTLINTLDDNDLFLESEAPASTVNVMRLLYQLLNKPLPSDDKEAWEVVKEFLSEAKTNGLEEELLRQAQEKFDFSDANVEALDSLHASVKDSLGQASQLGEFMMYLLQEALNYAGICSNPAPWRQYRRLKYKQSQAN